MVMKTKAILVATTLATAITIGPRLFAQVQTEVPAVVPGANRVMVKTIKVRGGALEESLEGEGVDGGVRFFLPPSSNRNRRRRYPVVYALHGYSIGAEQWSH